ncbi:ROK family protein [Actinomadura madurae]|nr:ROK family protein [Actinomadura madurae]
MVIKLGSGIGCGVIVDGRLHRGRGAAGDISHVRILSEATVDCSCGHPDCLEAHASGAALAASLAAQGIRAAARRRSSTSSPTASRRPPARCAPPDASSGTC